MADQIVTDNATSLSLAEPISKDTDTSFSSTGQRFKNDSSCSTAKLTLINALSEISQCVNRRHCHTLLESIFDCAKNGVNFDTEDKKKIGTTIKNRMEDILSFLFNFGWMFDPTNEISPMEYKSALEVILVDYKDFPTDVIGETLQKTLDKIESDDDTIEIMEETVKIWRQWVVSESQAFSASDLRRPLGIPSSHTWWD
jgi:hypothetical protein